MENTNNELPQAIVMCAEIMDHHDERDFLDTVYAMAAGGEAHIRKFEDWFVMSHEPLTDQQVEHAMRLDQLEQAREALKDGEEPYEVWSRSMLVSPQDISMILREEKIPADELWFSKGRKQEEEQHAKEDAVLAELKGKGKEYNRQLAELEAMPHPDNAVLRAFWDKHHHDAARDEWESCNRDEIGWEVQDNMKDEIFERIDEAVEEAWLREPVEEAFEEWLNQEGFLNTLSEKVEANDHD